MAWGVKANHSDREEKGHAWTFGIFVYGADIFAYADDSESDLDEKTAAGLQRRKRKQDFGFAGKGGGGVDDMLRPDLFGFQSVGVVKLVMVVCGGGCSDGHVRNLVGAVF